LGARSTSRSTTVARFGDIAPIGFGWNPWERRDPLETLVIKSGGRVSTSPVPCMCTLFLFSTCLVYFHKGVKWRYWGRGVRKKIPKLAIACHDPPDTLDILFLAWAIRGRFVNRNNGNNAGEPSGNWYLDPIASGTLLRGARGITSVRRRSRRTF